ncbi:hypothetical protein BGE01nite_33330 [Brevifollis gellanilyticus]|uniref:peptide-methionine (S)-S-oxide reductase n=2 Tax=Brevifollis gellanilyticus TaxID=748831 RepID=A0A512MBC6_9BACT|nr:hypothetical protein BGE01nite_33330 [Brevifollis gellanilyticus]
MDMKWRLLSLMLMLTSLSCDAAPPEEAGKVSWGRDLGTALASSRESGRPVFALFQEIPGCAGCKQFGRDVLSNPLVVEAIETEFTPLLIHNNKGGKDAEVLQRYGEPAWNFQVVRFLDAKGNDIISRRDQVWETCALSERMIAALMNARRPVPGYLGLLASEHFPRLKQAVFTMHCFWTGEMALGQIEGVISTEAGFMGGHEVTRVSYDPQAMPLSKLIAAAEKVDCARAVHVPATDVGEAKAARLQVGVISGYQSAPASDQKRQISGTALDRLHLTGAQATKMNAWLRSDAARALSFLTPSQRAQVK